MAAQIKDSLGTITINDRVITKIATEVAMQTYGIAGLTNKNSKDGIFVILKKENMSKGVVIKTEDDKVSIELSVIVRYNIKLTTATQNIIETVKFKVEKYTGLKVGSIDILIQDIQVQK